MGKRSLSVPPLCLGTLVHPLVLIYVAIVPCKLNVKTFGVLYSIDFFNVWFFMYVFFFKGFYMCAFITFISLYNIILNMH